MGTIAYHEYALRRAHGMGSNARDSARAGPVEISGFDHAVGTAKRTLDGVVSNAWQMFVDAMHERQARAELSRLGDDVLADRGIERDQIATVATGLVDARREAARKKSLSTRI